jgi:uncharacterized membrane protein YkvI
MNESLKFILIAVVFGLLAVVFLCMIVIAIVYYDSKRKNKRTK